MKYFILTALLASTSAYANTVETVFQPNSALPQDLKERILVQVKQKCSAGLLRNGLKEESTAVEVKWQDQGVRDSFFETTLRTTYYFDGIHPTFAFITVKSAEYEISNPNVDRFEILSISADADVCVK